MQWLAAGVLLVGWIARSVTPAWVHPGLLFVELLAVLWLWTLIEVELRQTRKIPWKSKAFWVFLVLLGGLVIVLWQV